MQYAAYRVQIIFIAYFAMISLSCDIQTKYSQSFQTIFDPNRKVPLFRNNTPDSGVNTRKLIKY